MNLHEKVVHRHTMICRVTQREVLLQPQIIPFHAPEVRTLRVEDGHDLYLAGIPRRPLLRAFDEQVGKITEEEESCVVVQRHFDVGTAWSYGCSALGGEHAGGEDEVGDVGKFLREGGGEGANFAEERDVASGG